MTNYYVVIQKPIKTKTSRILKITVKWEGVGGIEQLFLINFVLKRNDYLATMKEELNGFDSNITNISLIIEKKMVSIYLANVLHVPNWLGVYSKQAYGNHQIIYFQPQILLT